MKGGKHYENRKNHLGNQLCDGHIARGIPGAESKMTQAEKAAAKAIAKAAAEQEPTTEENALETETEEITEQAKEETTVDPAPLRRGSDCQRTPVMQQHSRGSFLKQRYLS